MEKAQTDDDRIAAMFKLGEDQWEQQKQHMNKYGTIRSEPGFSRLWHCLCPLESSLYALLRIKFANSKNSATPVYRPGGMKGKQANVPEHPPPAGYICYRCGNKGNH